MNKAVPAERYVLDASAIMCLVRNEPGAEAVKSALPRSSVSAVNLGEVVAKTSELGMDEALIAKVLDPLQRDIRPFESDLAHAREIRDGPRFRPIVIA